MVGRTSVRSDKNVLVTRIMTCSKRAQEVSDYSAHVRLCWTNDMSHLDESDK